MDESSTELVQRWRGGDEEAATELYRRYIQRLLCAIGGHLPHKLQARVDADDICQSVFRSMFRRIRHGEFTFEDDADVWKLLVTVGLNKLRNKVRFLAAQKRSVAKEVNLGDESAPDPFLVGHLSRGPDLEEAAEFGELMEQLCRSLPTLAVDLLRLRMEGYQQEEIAKQLHLSTRTIRRINNKIRDRLAEILSDDSSLGGRNPSV